MTRIKGAIAAVGFTGTQKGMTAAQKRTVIKLLLSIEPTTVCHGDCIGADAQFHELVVRKLPHCVIRLRPGYPKNKPGQFLSRAWCSKAVKTIYPAKEYLARDRDIALSNSLIACPKGHSEVVRSGTWATIRYARIANRLIYIVFPDGTVNKEKPVSTTLF